MIQVAELVDCSQQIMFNDTPATFEEDTDETVRARAFIFGMDLMVISTSCVENGRSKWFRSQVGQCSS
jgi:hypothetical protein